MTCSGQLGLFFNSLPVLLPHALQLLRLITAMDSDNYPECCHAIYIANGGATFGAIWRLVSPFIDKGTRDKVHVIGGGKNMHRVLAEAIGQEMLPNFLGGSLDYDAVRHEWLDKMDQAIAERQQHPQEQVGSHAVMVVVLQSRQQSLSSLYHYFALHSGYLCQYEYCDCISKSNPLESC